MADINGLPNGWSGTALELTIPQNVDVGTYVFYAALFPAGAPPRLTGGAIGEIATAVIEVNPTY